ncbi:hypothetical protein QUN99_003335 [Vibrio parahaemolyticus]|nr:hypothetical protein [Vibrio parahaemolyticus]
MMISLSFAIALLSIATLTQLFNKLCLPIIFRCNFTRKIYLITASIFVPIHELSHVIASLVFGHKINKVVLFSARSQNGKLGSVTHSWNPSSIYQTIGCFFIAIAPLVTASIVVFLMVKSTNTTIIINETNIESHYAMVEETIRYSYILTLKLFNIDSIDNWWLAIILPLLCYHCMPSSKDFENAFFGGFVLIAGGVFAHLFNIETSIDGELQIMALQIITTMLCATLLGLFFCASLTAIALMMFKEQQNG